MEFRDLLRTFLGGELVFEVRIRRVGQRPHDTGSAPATKRARRAQITRCTVMVDNPPPEAAVRPPTFADRVLELLREAPEPVSAGDLAEYFGATRSTMRVILSRMHHRGYLTRHGSGRSVRWSLREAGE